MGTGNARLRGHDVLLAPDLPNRHLAISFAIFHPWGCSTL